MKVMKYRDVEEKKPDLEGAEGVTVRWLISGKDGAPNFYMRRFEVKGHTPHHNHPFEHLNYIIEGNGSVIAGNREYEVKKGDFAMVLPGEVHQYRNTSTSVPLVIICVVPKEYE